MSESMARMAAAAGVDAVNVWGTLLRQMEGHLEMPSMNLPMIKRPIRSSGSTNSMSSASVSAALLSSDYYRMIEAVEYTRQCDDGASSAKWKEADILILGISRTGKNSAEHLSRTARIQSREFTLGPRQRRITNPVLHRRRRSKPHLRPQNLPRRSPRHPRAPPQDDGGHRGRIPGQERRHGRLQSRGVAPLLLLGPLRGPPRARPRRSLIPAKPDVESLGRHAQGRGRDRGAHHGRDDRAFRSRAHVSRASPRERLDPHSPFTTQSPHARHTNNSSSLYTHIQMSEFHYLSRHVTNVNATARRRARQIRARHVRPPARTQGARARSSAAKRASPVARLAAARASRAPRRPARDLAFEASRNSAAATPRATPLDARRRDGRGKRLTNARTTTNARSRPTRSCMTCSA